VAHDPVSNHAIVVNAATPRVLLAGGQCIYFSDYDNVDAFLLKSTKFVVEKESTTQAMIAKTGGKTASKKEATKKEAGKAGVASEQKESQQVTA
jgi:hypothetical protein